MSRRAGTSVAGARWRRHVADQIQSRFYALARSDAFPIREMHEVHMRIFPKEMVCRAEFEPIIEKPRNHGQNGVLTSSCTAIPKSPIQHWPEPSVPFVKETQTPRNPKGVGVGNPLQRDLQNHCAGYDVQYAA